MVVGRYLATEGPSTQYLRSLVPKAIKYWVLGPSELYLGPSPQGAWIAVYAGQPGQPSCYDQGAACRGS